MRVSLRFLPEGTEDLETTILETEVSTAHQLTVGDLLKNKTWLATLVASVVALGFVYWHTIDWWWKIWWADESYYSHGALIPFISGFVVYFNRNKIKRTPVEPTLMGFAVLVPAIAVQFIGHRGGILSVAGLSLPLALYGLSLILMGKRVTRELLFPIIFLFFMCVPPTQYVEKLGFKIQMLSTTLATIGLKAIGLDAIQKGNQIHLPNIQVEVARACSGFRMLIALLAFTTLFAYMKEGARWGRLVLIALVIPLSLFANAVRVLLIALVGEYRGEETMHVFHDYSGYIVLVIAFFLLTLIARVLKCKDFRSMPS